MASLASARSAAACANASLVGANRVYPTDWSSAVFRPVFWRAASSAEKRPSASTSVRVGAANAPAARTKSREKARMVLEL